MESSSDGASEAAISVYFSAVPTLRREPVKGESHAFCRWVPVEVQRLGDVEAVDHCVHESTGGAATGGRPDLHPRGTQRGKELLRGLLAIEAGTSVGEHVPLEAGS